jgi:hypothetical protein
VQPTSAIHVCDRDFVKSLPERFFLFQTKSRCRAEKELTISKHRKQKQAAVIAQQPTTPTTTVPEIIMLTPIATSPATLVGTLSS